MDHHTDRGSKRHLVRRLRTTIDQEMQVCPSTSGQMQPSQLRLALPVTSLPTAALDWYEGQETDADKGYPVAEKDALEP